METTSAKIILIDNNYGKAQPPLPATRFLHAFLNERGHKLLNIELYANTSAPTVFENTLHLLKQATLGIFLLNQESIFLGFLLQQAMEKQKKCLFYSQNQKLLDQIKGITFKWLYPVPYSKEQEIISHLKLNQL